MSCSRAHTNGMTDIVVIIFLMHDDPQFLHAGNLKIGGIPLRDIVLSHLSAIFETADIWILTNLAKEHFIDRQNRTIIRVSSYSPSDAPRWSSFLSQFREHCPQRINGHSYRHVMLVNGMNPLLTESLIRSVVAGYGDSTAVAMVTAKTLMDSHPALNWLYYTNGKNGPPMRTSGPMDTWERFAAIGLWTVDRQTQQIRSSRTGRVMTGRQQFPAIYELDGNLMLFRKEAFEKLETLLFSSATMAYPLIEKISDGTVTDRFSFLRAKMYYGSHHPA